MKIKRFDELNEGSNNKIDNVRDLIVGKLNELVGEEGEEFEVSYHNDTNKFYVTFYQSGNGKEECEDIANQVVDFLLDNNQKWYVGNYDEKMFWLTTNNVNEEVLPKGMWSDSNQRAIATWTNREPDIEYVITTKEPVSITTTDDVQASKIKMLFYKHDIKFDIKELRLK